MPTDDFEALAARADFARLLAACYYEPGPEFVEERLCESIAEAAGRINTSLAEQAGWLAKAFEGEDLQELLVDYTRLFLGPIDAPARPYGSVWLDDRHGLMQDSTMAVIALYDEGGFEIADDFRDLPDHVAAELEFLYLLLFRQAEAVRNDDVQARARFAQLHRRLVDEQLGRWIGAFTDAMGVGAQTDFYRALGRLTRAFVDRERAGPVAG